MKNAVDGVWLDSNLYNYFIIRDGKLTTYVNKLAPSEINDINNMDVDALEKLSAEDYYNKHFSAFTTSVKYDYENAKIVSLDGYVVYLTLSSSTQATNQTGAYCKKESYVSESSMKDNFLEEFASLKKEVILEEKYPNIGTARDAQYDKYEYRGKNFLITGTAELDDYYNWGYDNYEYSHFCILVTPTGGSYSDRWYIYASRSDYKKLFEKLKSGSKSLTLVAKIVYADTGSSNMATLVDYFE